MLSFVTVYVRVSSTPTASHNSVSAGQIRIMWQRYSDPTASFISGYRVIYSYSAQFKPADIILCHNSTTSASQSEVTLTDLNPAVPIYVRVEVVRLINGFEAVDEVQSDVSDLICPGKQY